MDGARPTCRNRATAKQQIQATEVFITLDSKFLALYFIVRTHSI